MSALAKDSSIQSVINDLGYNKVVIDTPEWINGAINYKDGKDTASSSYRRTGYYELDGAVCSNMFCSLYTASNTTSAVSFYDADKNYIKGYYSIDNFATREKSHIIEIPYNTKYVRFSIFGTAVSQWFAEYYTGSVVSAVQRVRYATEWHNDQLSRIASLSIRDNTAKYSDALDVSNVGMVSLRVISTLDVPCKISLVNDMSADKTDDLIDSTGNSIEFDIQASSATIILPEDAPALKYLNYIKVKVKCVTAPTSGDLKIYVFGKK